VNPRCCGAKKGAEERPQTWRGGRERGPELRWAGSGRGRRPPSPGASGPGRRSKGAVAAPCVSGTATAATADVSPQNVLIRGRESRPRASGAGMYAYCGEAPNRPVACRKCSWAGTGWRARG